MGVKALIRKAVPPAIWLALRRMRNRVLGIFSYGRGFRFASEWSEPTRGDHPDAEEHPVEQDNPLWSFFQAHTSGPGIWKWEHYFPVYHRHFEKFIGRNPKVVEIGVYSGGSLGLWSEYFGECEIYGVDIAEECRAYESDNVSIFIGDQADPSFWDEFKREVPAIDILVDDGGHTPRQQRVTLECMLPHLRRGGVYICEDVGGIHNLFASFAAGIASELNRDPAESGGGVSASDFQFGNFSVHFYPFMVVIERAEAALTRMYAPKHGSEWQPFLDKHLLRPAADTRR